jgi:hypothetical protein
VVEIALTPAEAVLFGDEWEAVLAELSDRGREAVFTGRVARRSADAGDLDVAAAITLDPDMAPRDALDVLRLHVHRTVGGRTRILAIYGAGGLLETRLDVADMPQHA